MQKPKLTRNQIHIISRHSNWPAADIKNRFEQDGIYADSASWAKFIDIVLISLGAAFCLAGVIFFFAYNWDDLHKFAKLCIIGALIIACTLAAIVIKQHQLVKNLLLTAASILVGVLFSVFGQIYQTGADAYDFFLGWTIFTALWALVSGFEVLWLIWLVLANATFVFYVDQAGPGWGAVTVCLIMAVFSSAIILSLRLLSQAGKITQPADWFLKTLALGIAGCFTISVISGVLGHYPPHVYSSMLIAALIYFGGAYYSIRIKSLYYLCLVAISTIFIIAIMLGEAVKFDSGVLIFITLFVVVSITIVVKQLTGLNQKWHGNN
jgi:uncharacterized membrane protein